MSEKADANVIGAAARGTTEGLHLALNVAAMLISFLSLVALVNLLRRPGTPLLVRDAQSDTKYEEGRDFATVTDPQLDFRFDHDGPPIRLLPGGRVRDGQKLRVSYFHGMAIHDGQVTVCMSEPKLYEIWQRQTELIERHLAPRRWLLSMDEIRAGGSCEACRSRQLSMAEILGDCLKSQYQMIRRVNPQAEVFVGKTVRNERAWSGYQA